MIKLLDNYFKNDVFFEQCVFKIKNILFACSLINAVVDHLNDYGLEGLPHQFKEQFPQTITVGEAVATWKAIVFYQQQHEHDIKS